MINIKYTINSIDDNTTTKKFVVKPSGLPGALTRIETNSFNGMSALVLDDKGIAADQEGKTFFALPVGKYSITIQPEKEELPLFFEGTKYRFWYY